MLELGNLPPQVAKVAKRKMRKREKADLARAAGTESEEKTPVKAAPVPRKGAAKADKPRQPKRKPDSTPFVTGWGKDGTRINHVFPLKTNPP
jgi:hypothetical protein